DGRFNHAHRRSTKHLDFIDKWDNDKLPDDERKSDIIYFADFLSPSLLKNTRRFTCAYKPLILEIAVPLKHQPSFSEENENFDLVPEQLKPGANNKWKDLALDFF
ncbi:11575_t:CDS:2, partial [Racocetra persica]